jgi:hypothetical protein
MGLALDEVFESRVTEDMTGLLIIGLEAPPIVKA